MRAASLCAELVQIARALKPGEVGETGMLTITREEAQTNYGADVVAFLGRAGASTELTGAELMLVLDCWVGAVRTDQCAAMIQQRREAA